MSKKFRIGQQKQVTILSPQAIAQRAKRALDNIAPLVRAQGMSPIKALVLAATAMDYFTAGKERYLTVDEIQDRCEMIVTLWERGLFTPNKSYPHSLETTLSAWNDRSEGSEVEA